MRRRAFARLTRAIGLKQNKATIIRLTSEHSKAALQADKDAKVAKAEWWTQKQEEMSKLGQTDLRKLFELLRRYSRMSAKKALHLGAVVDPVSKRLVSPGEVGFVEVWRQYYEKLGREEGAPAPTALKMRDLNLLGYYCKEAGPAELEAKFDEWEVARAIAQLQWGKAPESDGIKGDLLKMTLEVIKKPLTALFNLVRERELVPELWA